MFTTLLKKADSFFKRFSLKRLKLGAIIGFLDQLGMTDSKDKLAEVLKSIKVIIYTLYRNKGFKLLSLLYVDLYMSTQFLHYKRANLKIDCFTFVAFSWCITFLYVYTSNFIFITYNLCLFPSVDS